MSKKKRVVIVGATSGIAEHCARLWVNRNVYEIVLLGRKKSKLDCIAVDLRVRAPDVNVVVIETELTDPVSIEAAVAISGKAEIVLIAFGMLPEQKVLENNVLSLSESLYTNAVAPVLWAEAFACAANFAPCRIALIGSVAGDRGRKSNYVYGAAKGLLDQYIQGMQHRFARTSVLPIIIKPGPTQTAMTSHIDDLQMAAVETVAEIIVSGIDSGRPEIYAPRRWAFIMTVLKHLPRFIFNRLDI
ncbi:SDR family NAD(P)-dependent oxidoreductase [Planktomarina temperata]|nr:SDR family NAD(P)-dependent oxidoreductase [Planktomarina temperata]